MLGFDRHSCGGEISAWFLESIDDFELWPDVPMGRTSCKTAPAPAPRRALPEAPPIAPRTEHTSHLYPVSVHTVVIDPHAMIECLLSQLLLRILHHFLRKLGVGQRYVFHLHRLWRLDVLFAREQNGDIARLGHPAVGGNGVGHCGSGGDGLEEGRMDGSMVGGNR